MTSHIRRVTKKERRWKEDELYGKETMLMEYQSWNSHQQDKGTSGMTKGKKFRGMSKYKQFNKHGNKAIEETKKSVWWLVF